MSLDNVNPGTYIKGTTWVLVSQDKYIKGAKEKDTSSKGGGSSTINISHTHLIEEHTHSIAQHNHTIESHTHDVTGHTHTIESHTHSIAQHNHAIESHTHSIAQHKHSLSAHQHLQTYGDDDTAFYFTAGYGSYKQYDDNIFSAGVVREEWALKKPASAFGFTGGPGGIISGANFHLTSNQIRISGSEDSIYNTGNTSLTTGSNTKSLTTGNKSLTTDANTKSLATGSKTLTTNSNTKSLVTGNKSLTTGANTKGLATAFDSESAILSIQPEYITIFIWKRTA